MRFTIRVQKRERTVLKHVVAIGALVMASVGVAAAQGQPEARPAPTGTSQRDQQVQARYNIIVMERVLEGAVAHGADQVRRHVRRLMPDLVLLTGEAQARGFRLDGYGVFFDVSVPGVRPSVDDDPRQRRRHGDGAAAAEGRHRADGAGRGR
jgi:hypothetical protein